MTTFADRPARLPVLEAQTTLAPDFIARDICLAQEALAGFDWLALRVSPTYLGAGIARGSGEPVVLVPGMLASNASMSELRQWLRRVGYTPYVTDIERNSGCPERVLDRVLVCIDQAYEETGDRVYIVGHSLGGVLARAAAMARPHKVARVVTLGSPVNGCRVHPMVALAGLLTRGDCDGHCMDSFQDPLPAGITETSIYSRTDGIVDWHTCFRDDAEAIEVRGTHCGLAFNAEVFRALGNLLATPLAATPPPPMRRSRVMRSTLPEYVAEKRAA